MSKKTIEKTKDQVIKELTDLGFVMVQDEEKKLLIAAEYQLSKHLKIEFSRIPVTGFNLVLPDETRITLNIKDANDIISLGLIFKDCLVDANAELFC